MPAMLPASYPPCRLRRIQIVIVALILILAGSFCGAVLTWLQGAGPLHIMLGYVGGGWVGFLGGMPILLMVQMIRCRLLGKTQAGLHSPIMTPAMPAAPIIPHRTGASPSLTRSVLTSKSADLAATRLGSGPSDRSPRHRSR